MADKSTDDDILTEAKKRYQESEDAWAEVKRDSIDDTKFSLLGEQWPPDVVQQRQLDGRPCLTINKTQAFGRQIINDMRKNRPRIKTRAANESACSKVAEIIDGLIRNIEVTSNADTAYDTAGENAVNGGLGFFRVDIDYEYDDSFDKCIKISRIANPISVSWDAYSQAEDSADWRYCFISEMVPKEVHKAEYPKAKLEASDFGSDPQDVSWINGDSIRRAEYFTRELTDREIYLLANGEVVAADIYATLEDTAKALPDLQIAQKRTTKSYKVTHRVITGAEILETTEWAGTYIPVVPVWGREVNVEGKRYYQSLIRHAKDAQRMFNYWRTTATELVALAPKAPWIGKKGTFKGDIEKWQSANTKSHPFIEYDTEMPERQPFAGVPAGALQEAANSSDDMKAILGLYDASLGAKSNETSGIAIHRRMAEGDNSTFDFIDNLNRGIRCAGRIIVELIPRVYNKPRVLRILGEDGKCQTVKVNQPPQLDPATGNALNELYDLTVGKYDVVVEAGPSYTTQRTETADMITQVIGAAPQTAPLLAPMLLKMSDFPDADKVSKILETMMPPAAAAAMNGQPPPPPSPPPEVAAKQAEAQANMQIEQQKAQHQFQLGQQANDNKLKIEQTQAQADIVVMQQIAQAEMQIMRERAALEMDLKRQEAQLAAELKALSVPKTPNLAPGVQ